MKPPEVIVYTTSYCPYCMRAKAFLKSKGLSFQEVDVTGDEAKRTWLIEQTGMRTVPQIFINGKSIGGCDDMLALEANGAFDSLLTAP